MMDDQEMNMTILLYVFCLKFKCQSDWIIEIRTLSIKSCTLMNTQPLRFSLLVIYIQKGIYSWSSCVQIEISQNVF
jgi:hypothetical protein